MKSSQLHFLIVSTFLALPLRAAPEIVVEQADGTPLSDGATLAFGVVDRAAPKILILRVRNSGTSALTGLSITRDGTNSTHFAHTELPVTELASGAIAEFTVTFSPRVGAPVSAALHIASNDADESPFDLSLTGSGSNFVSPVFNSAADLPWRNSSIGIGTLTYTGLTLGFSPTLGTELRVYDNTSNNALSERLINLPDGGTVTAIYNGINYVFLIDYTGGSGNDIVFITLGISQTPTLHAVAIDGQPLPDGNGRFSNGGLGIQDFTPPAINNRGVVCFYAGAEDYTGASSYWGLYAGNPTVLSKVARGGQRPTVLNGGEFLDNIYASGAINDAGQVAFLTRATPNGSSVNFGVFRKDTTSDGYMMLARTGDAAPGEGVFSSTFDSSRLPVLGASGHVAFHAPLAGTNGGSSDDAGIYRSNAEGNTVVKIAQQGDIVPGGTEPMVGIGQPIVNASGQVAFLAMLGINSNEAIVRGNGSVLETLVREGQVIAGVGTINNFTSYGISMNDQGSVAFCLSNNITNGAAALARISGTGDLELVAVQGNSIPGTTRKWSVIDSAPYINHSRQVAYSGRIVNTSNGADARTCVFLDQTIIAMEGQTAPGGGATFIGSVNEPFALNDAGQVAFKTQITVPILGNGYGIYFYSGTGGLQEVARLGTPFLGSSIRHLEFSGTTGGDAVSKCMQGLNNAGEVAFRFELADGREGIAVWSSLPKPTSGGSGQIQPIAGGFQVRFPGIPGWDYVIERDEDLLPPWSLLPARRANEAGWITFDDLGPGLPPKRFYRCAEAP